MEPTGPIESRRHDTRSGARLSRRQIVRLLAALGFAGPAAGTALAQARKKISRDVLSQAATLLDQDYGGERLAVIEKALQRNLDQFQLVRDLELDDSIEPAVIFRLKGR